MFLLFSTLPASMVVRLNVMKKIIKSGIFFVLAYFLISAVSYAAETEAAKEKEQPAEAL